MTYNVLLPFNVQTSIHTQIFTKLTEFEVLYWNIFWLSWLNSYLEMSNTIINLGMSKPVIFKTLNPHTILIYCWTSFDKIYNYFLIYFSIFKIFQIWYCFKIYMLILKVAGHTIWVDLKWRYEAWVLIFFSVWHQPMDKRKMAKFNLRFRKIRKTKQKRCVNRTVFLFTLLLLHNRLAILRILIKQTYQAIKPKLIEILDKKRKGIIQFNVYKNRFYPNRFLAQKFRVNMQ